MERSAAFHNLIKDFSLDVFLNFVDKRGTKDPNFVDPISVKRFQSIAYQRHVDKWKQCLK